jgi:nicotinamidase-related amidase
MPLTKLDTISALIVIDLQKGILGSPTVHPVADIIGRAAQLARAFRERGLPVLLVNVTGVPPGRSDVAPRTSSFPADLTELVPELRLHPSDHTVTKQRWGAFIGTSLHDYLRQRGVTQVLLAGISTSAGVESTARSAYDYGYNLVLIVDAITDRDADAQRHCLEKVFPRLGEADTTNSVLNQLQNTHPH